MQRNQVIESRCSIGKIDVKSNKQITICNYEYVL